MTVALIDADGLVYATGAVSEKVYYLVGDVRFEYKSEANEYCDENNIDRKDIERAVDAEPVAHALGAMRTTLDSILEKIGADTHEIYLSNLDRNNFRHVIYKDYKANRNSAHRPVHFEAIRNWLINKRGAVVVEGYEPDDELNIRAHELGFDTPWVIVSNDKDLVQIPGRHYNWKDHKIIDVPIWDATVSLYYQLLVGDSIDNIKGCPRIGPAKAKAALKNKETEEALLDTCLRMYIDAYKGDEEKARAELKLNAQLVRLLPRRPDGPST